jgi:ferredoxin-NADP reductase
LSHINPDAKGTKRYFTISSAPFENVVNITTRITDSTFKQALSKLSKGAELSLLNIPDGDFIWHDSHLPIIFIAGGIGVTPFYSILKQRFHNNLPLKVTLIYVNRTADIPFKKDLDQWAVNDSTFIVDYEVGLHLSAEYLITKCPNLNSSIVYLSGPEPMVETIGDQFQKNGLSKSQLKQDYFSNYTENNY